MQLKAHVNNMAKEAGSQALMQGVTSSRGCLSASQDQHGETTLLSRAACHLVPHVGVSSRTTMDWTRRSEGSLLPMILKGFRDIMAVQARRRLGV